MPEPWATIQQTLQEEFADLPDAALWTRGIVRLSLSMAFAAFLGYERQRQGKAAGLRTHMLLALGTCLAVLASSSSGMDTAALSRVVQGLVTGVGFLGGGAILKRKDKHEHEIEGLTTAAGIWATAAIGAAVGMGRVGLGAMATILALVVLSILGKIERLLPSLSRQPHD